MVKAPLSPSQSRQHVIGQEVVHERRFLGLLFLCSMSASSLWSQLTASWGWCSQHHLTKYGRCGGGRRQSISCQGTRNLWTGKYHWGHAPWSKHKKESVLSLKHYSDLFGMCLYCVCACEWILCLRTKCMHSQPVTFVNLWQLTRLPRTLMSSPLWSENLSISFRNSHT